MFPVFVLSKNGTKLMPTTRFGRVRHFLKDGKAKIVTRNPFTIQLQYDSSEYIQNLELGVDSGYVHFAISLKSEQKEFYSAEYTMISDEKKRHDDSRKYRRTRRNRLRYRAPRFLNRIATKKDGWIAPSLQHKVDAQVQVIKSVCNVAPVKHVVVEVGVFDPALLSAMQTTGIPPRGIEYQHGPLYYVDNLRNAIFQRDKYTCQICKKSALKDHSVILHMHHALFWQNRHANTVKECITVCSNCHTSKNHQPGGKLWGLTPKVPRLEGATFMNIVRWKLINILKHEHLNITISSTYGSLTARIRKNHGLEKTHANDAFCIGKFYPKHRTQTVYLTKRRRNNRCLEKFYDAKYIDIRDDSKKSGKELGCNRVNRREPRNSEKNLRIYRGTKLSSGHRNIRKKKTKIQVGDTVVFKNKKYPVLGSSTNVHGDIYVLLVQPKNSLTGKAVKPSLNKISVKKSANGWVQNIYI